MRNEFQTKDKHMKKTMLEVAYERQGHDDGFSELRNVAVEAHDRRAAVDNCQITDLELAKVLINLSYAGERILPDVREEPRNKDQSKVIPFPRRGAEADRIAAAGAPVVGASNLTLLNRSRAQSEPVCESRHGKLSLSLGLIQGPDNIFRENFGANVQRPCRF